MNYNDTENHMVLPDSDPCDGYSAVDEEDRAYEESRQEAIDSAIEAGDHLLDSRKEDALNSVIIDIAGGQIRKQAN